MKIPLKYRYKEGIAGQVAELNKKRKCIRRQPMQLINLSLSFIKLGMREQFICGLANYSV